MQISKSNNTGIFFLLLLKKNTYIIGYIYSLQIPCPRVGQPQFTY